LLNKQKKILKITQILQMEIFRRF